VRTHWPASLAVAAALAAFSPATAAIISVPDDQPTIQAGIDAASEGDTVLVAPGTYAGESNRGLDFGMKNIVLRSENGADETVIDCEHQDRGLHFHGGQDSTSVVSGFTILNGTAETGGGVYCDQSSPTIAACIFSANSADGFDRGGGGVGCRLSSPSITDCGFYGNTSEYGGGGVSCYENSSPLITNCTFTGNDAYNGGGVRCRFSSPTIAGCTFSANASANGGGLHGDHSSPTITDCTFSGNIADGDGGAMRFVSFCSASITSCTFTENSALVGGGVNGDECSLAVEDCVFSENTAESRGGGLWLFCEDSYPTITNCVFSGNSAGSYGGGMYSFGFEPTVTGCVFASNSAGQNGGGIYLVWYWQTVTNCTFFSNTAGGLGGGVYCDDASTAITNTIVSFSTSGGAIVCEGATVPEITRSCFYGNVGAGGDSLCGTYYDNLFANPLFCDPDGGDLRLSENSPCLPANTPWGELVGALALGCEASDVEATSWGALKAMFR
jgi:predicted outer membrane repeat protein